MLRGGPSHPLSPAQQAVSLLIFLAGLLYVPLLWGRAYALLPEPVNRLDGLCWRCTESWWRQHFLTGLPGREPRLWLWVFANLCFGVVLPAMVLVPCGRRLREVGLGLPNLLGRRLVLASVLASIPFGFLLGAARAQAAATSGLLFEAGTFLLLILPEHFLISGVFVALLLPERRLPEHASLAVVEGRPMVKALRWLGLAQPAVTAACGPATASSSRTPSPALPREAHARPGLAWFGLSRPELWAILGSGVLFCLVHVGKGGLELALSLPGGVAVAYVTLRSRSVWPAVIAHWTLYVAPLGMGGFIYS